MPIHSFDLFLDESGDHLLHPPEHYEKDATLESHCTLVGVVLSNAQKEQLKTELSELKKHFWKTDEVVLHSVKIRNKEGAFAIFHYKPELYEEFKRRKCELIQRIKPTIICSSLNKKLWVKKYPRKLFFGDDPYEQAFVFLLERYAHFLNAQKREGIKVVGRVVAECRDSKKDKQIRDSYLSIKQDGTQYFRGNSHFDCMPGKMDFFKKSFNVPGLQLSDYACYPFYANHKYPKSENKLYDFLEQFVYPGDHGKYGHKKWPV